MAGRRQGAEGEPRPFLKWAGGKTQLLPEIELLLPELGPRATYHEPFVGSGALFFRLATTGRLRAGAVLSDTNDALIQTWTCVRDAPEALAKRVQSLGRHHSTERYYAERAVFNDTILSPLERAALVIYLNKAGFNGLWRVNADGKFNVPCGRQASGPQFPDALHLTACSRVLQGVELREEPFEAVLERARPGDLVYFDPPYVPVSVTASFTAYTGGGFGPADQLRLRDVFTELEQRGCHVLLSNSDTLEARELYAGLDVTRVAARRSINSKGTARGPVGELLVRSRAPAKGGRQKPAGTPAGSE